VSQPLKYQTILVVEDEPDLLELLKEELSQYDFSIQTASSGNEAIQTLKTQTIALVLTDLQMPNGDGASVLRHVQTMEAQPICLVMTGYAPYSEDQLYEMGARAVLHKPFDMPFLIESVRKLMVRDPKLRPRTCPRMKVSLPIQYRFIDSQELKKSKITNLGLGGMFLQLNEKYPSIGEKLTFNVAIDQTEQTLSGEGLTRWVCFDKKNPSNCGVGIEFKNLSSSALALIKRLFS